MGNFGLEKQLNTVGGWDLRTITFEDVEVLSKLLKTMIPRQEAGKGWGTGCVVMDILGCKPHFVR